MLDLGLLYGTLLVCAVFIGWVVWRYDLYDKEPPLAILSTVVFGAGLMWVAGRVQVFLINATVDHAHELAGNTLWAIYAGVVEEVGKLVAVLLTLVVFRKHFNDPMDGLIYGAFAGLGAAIEESVFHLRLNSTTGLLPGQEPVRLAGHLVMGGIGGFGLGTWALRLPRWWLWTIASLAGAALLHSLWDIVAFDASDQSTPQSRHAAGGVVLMFLGMIAFRVLVAQGQRLAKTKCHLRSPRIP